MRKYRFAKTGGWLAISCALMTSQISTADVNLNGFATITGGKTLADDETLNNYDSDFLFEENSFFGVQVDADLGDGLTAVAQIVSRGKESWETKFEWAYLGYQINDNVKILAGRQRLPFYAYSDYIDIGYAYHWITPPESIYSVPFNSSTGLGALITNQFGSASSTLHLSYGRNTEELPTEEGNRYNTDVSNLIAAAWTIEYDWLTLRAGVSSADLKIDIDSLDQLAAGWEQLGQAMSAGTGDPSYASDWAAFSDNIRYNDGNDKAGFGGLAAIVDYNDFVVVAETKLVTTEGSITEEEAYGYYVSLGKRFGNFMPHITYGEHEATPQDDSFLDGPKTLAADLGMMPNPTPEQAALIGGLNGLIAGTSTAFNNSISEKSYIVVGLRWDFHPSAAFKVEYKSQNDKLPVDSTNNLLRFSICTVF